jgi:hypothetical protein
MRRRAERTQSAASREGGAFADALFENVVAGYAAGEVEKLDQ